MNITRLRAQIRAGRELLGLKQGDVAQKMGVSLSKISRAESGDSKGVDTLLEIQQFLLRSGIELTEDGGVRPKQSKVALYFGHEGFVDFYDDVYEVATTHPDPDICVTSADEDQYFKWHGSYAEIHVARMRKLSKKLLRVLLKAEDTQVPASSYADYRWVNAEQFSNSSVYIYGDKAAFIDFQPDNVSITVVENQSIAFGMRKIFNFIWASASTKPISE